ncbi:MAG TPA: DUF4412 domain-containing protein [Bacteroidota bacterium]|nr:DUF4412 domain-containing protein [Bacteroidota bacterium]
MKSSRISTGGRIIAMLFLVTGLVCAQGFYWETTVTGAPGGDRISKSYISQRIFKIEQEDKDKTAMIVNLDKKLIITINGDDEEYSEITFEQLEAHMKKMEAKMEQMQKQFKEMPEAQRKMMEGLMGPLAGGSGPIVVKRSAEKKTILGYACGKVDVQQGDKTIVTLWATNMVKGFDKIRADWDEFSTRMAAMMPGSLGKGMTEGMKKVGGFPLETIMGSIVSTVTKLEERAIPAATFDVPAGYDKVDSELLKHDEE